MRRQLLRSVWTALELQLPASRMREGERFFGGGKPLPARARADVLRAMARTFIEAGYVALPKDARHDPVELIASALEVALAEAGDVGASPVESLISVCSEVAVRVAAFEMLFRTTVFPSWEWRCASAALIDQLANTATLEEVPGALRAFIDARAQAKRSLSSISVHRDALLAEIIILGSRHQRVHATDLAATDLPFAHGIVLVGQHAFGDALVVFERILDHVPGHALALEQAARCFFELGDTPRAHRLTKRASRLGRTAPRNVSGIRRSASGDCQHR